MFVCRACLRSLSGARPTPIESRLLRPLRNTAGLGSYPRMYHGESIQVDMRGALADPIKPAKVPPTPITPKDDSVLVVGAGEGGEGVKSDELGRQNYEKKLQWIVNKHLETLKDPYHIAQHVSKVLDKGSFDEAMLMTRMASRDAKVEVSWNHLIDYQMQNKRLNAAVKLYNEMKKRAQVPNAKTYTIIFRGCARSIHPKLAVAEATRIYNFMLNLGALKPNTIHMNAVLEVCARAGDMDSLFTILKSSNESLRAPDSYTFTIVLNALKHDAIKTDKGLGLVDQDAKDEIQQQIQRANAVWADVMARWRGGKLLVDEQLVCAMGRILVNGDYQDNENVLELIQQTMLVPRLDLVGGNLPPAPEHLEKPQAPADTKSKTTTPPPASAEKSPAVSSPKERRERLAKADGNPLYAQPSSKTLSLVLTALTRLRKTSHANKYWEFFTKRCGVTPDRDNYVTFLRALASGHASKQVAQLIEAFPASILQPATFRIGFGACVHDNRSPDAFKNACRIFDVMATETRYSDALAMRLFLHCARANTQPIFIAASGNEKEGALAHGKQLLTAIDRMWEPFRILLGSFSYPEQATVSPEQAMDKMRGDLQEAMATARRMISAIDLMVNERMIPLKTVKTVSARRIILQKMVERYILKLYPDGAANDKAGRKYVQDIQQLDRTWDAPKPKTPHRFDPTQGAPGERPKWPKWDQ